MRTVAGKLLIVDDLASNRDMLGRLLSADGYEVVVASDGREGFDAALSTKPDLVLTDLQMPHADGVELCHRLKENPATRLTPVVLMTGLGTADHRLRAIEAGCDDFLIKPICEEELRARVRSLVSLKRYTDDLDSAESVILSLAMTIESRDPYTKGHCQRLAKYAVALGKRLALPADDLAALHRGGFLHDIGKIAIPDAILLKPGRLTDDEFAQMKQHTVIGDHLCGNLRCLRHVRPIVRHHHERLDGGGYPDGLRGDSIPLLAQIIGIVDVYDALTTGRSYKPALTGASACAALRGDVAQGWRDASLVEAFIKTL
jgi:putative two-component system response regulator